MSSVLTYLQNSWSRSNPDAASKENWEATMDVVEKDRQRDRILAWRDRVGGNDCPVRRELAPWRSDAVCPNTTGPGSSRRALGLTQAAAKVSTQRHVSGRSHGAGGVSPSGPGSSSRGRARSCRNPRSDTARRLTGHTARTQRWHSVVRRAAPEGDACTRAGLHACCAHQSAHKITAACTGIVYPTHVARPYLYNLEVYGHKVYSRRSAKDIASADEENSRRVEAGELGPLSPLD
ncbi:MAG: hypothetical protein WDW38_002658 [Sanguina aurantia]